MVAGGRWILREAWEGREGRKEVVFLPLVGAVVEMVVQVLVGVGIEAVSLVTLKREEMVVGGAAVALVGLPLYPQQLQQQRHQEGEHQEEGFEPPPRYAPLLASSSPLKTASKGRQA